MRRLVIFLWLLLSGCAVVQASRGVQLSTNGSIKGWRYRLDAIAPPPDLFCPTLSDSRGNVQGIYDQRHGGITWNQSRVTGYGAVPGYRPLPLGSGQSAELAGSSAWRGSWPDVTGYYCLGMRYYDPTCGRWLSDDSLGHGADPGLQTYCGGDPINIIDFDGRLGVGNEGRGGLEAVLGSYEGGGGGRASFARRIQDIIARAGADPVPTDTRYTYAPEKATWENSAFPWLGHALADGVLNSDLRQQSWRELRNPDFSTPIGWATFGTALIGGGAGLVDAGANVVIPGKGIVEAAAKDAFRVATKEVVEVATKGTERVAVRKAAEADVWVVGRHGDMPSPRLPGTQSHHAVNSVWMEANVPGYGAADAPAILMRNEPFHNSTRGVFNRMRSEIAARQGVSTRDVDWSKVSPGTAWRLAEEQLEAAKVPPSIREEFFRQFNEYLSP